VTLTFDAPHNFVVYSLITIDNMRDTYALMQKSMTSNVATITTTSDHNIPAGAKITISGMDDIYTITDVSLTDGIARIGIGDHNCQVNDQITISNIKDSLPVIAVSMTTGIASLYFSSAHNFSAGDEVTVSGIDATFNGTYELIDVTDLEVKYKTANAQKIADANQAYETAVATAIQNNKTPSTDGDVQTAWKNLQTITNAANSNVSSKKTATSALVTSKSSIFNGTYTISDTTQRTVLFNKSTASDELSRPITPPVATVSKRSANGETCTLTFTATPPFAVGDNVYVSAITSRYNSPSAVDFFPITGVDYTTNTITYKYKNGADESEVASSGTVTGKTLATINSVFSGDYTASSVTSNTVSYSKTSTVTSRSASADTQFDPGLCALVLDTSQVYKPGEQIVIAGVGSRYNGTVSVINCIETEDSVTITYSKSGVAESSTSSSGTVTAIRINVPAGTKVAYMKICLTK
jgi:hypothetical protein